VTGNLTIEAAPAVTAQPVRTHVVRGGGGVGLQVHEWGPANGPAIVFVHGWSQCDMCWDAQVKSPLAERFRMITFDLRGHGMSDKPADGASYTDQRLWAQDLAAVIDQTHAQRPVVVAWSYGGLVVGDYVREHGDGQIAGINLVGAAIVLAPPAFPHIGPGFLDHAMNASAPDLRTNIDAISRFLRACTNRPLPADLWNTALGWNLAVSPAIRGALIARDIDATDVYSRLSVPVLVSHGRRDTVVLPSMAEHVLGRCPTAAASWYDEVGHIPFVEETGRFNLELAAFADGVPR
jgi:non-heme chloroperoxidase